MEINKEELEKYVEAIKAVIDNSLFNDLSKCVLLKTSQNYQNT